MTDKLKFNCACGKTLSADPKLAGKKAKCPNCAQIVVIPTSKPAAATPRAAAATKKPPAVIAAKRTTSPSASAAAKPARKAESPLAPRPERSIFDEEGEYELEHPPTANCSICTQALPPGAMSCPHCGDALPSGKTLSATHHATKRSRPTWMYFAAFGIYVLLVWIVSLFSPLGSMVLVMPFVALGMLAFMFGSLWYFLVLLRDNPGEAGVLFFGILLAFVGMRASTAGYMTGKMRGGRPANPSHSRPVKWIKRGALLLTVGMGASLIVGILWGAWRRDYIGQYEMPAFKNDLRSMPSEDFRPPASHTPGRSFSERGRQPWPPTPHPPPEAMPYRTK